MSIFCSCSTYGANTGKPTSEISLKTAEKLILVNLVSDQTGENYIANTDTIDPAYLTAKLNNDDPTARWYPIGFFKNVSNVREDANFFEYDDGDRSVTRLGRKTWTGFLPSHGPRYLSKLESWSCQEFGFYGVDDCGSLIGRVSPDGTKLYPITVNQDTFVSQLQEQSKSQPGGINLAYDVASQMKDKDLRVISFNDMTADLLNAKGLRDVTAVASAISQTGCTLTMTLPYDGFIGASPHPAASGWVTADFDDAFNTTDSLAVTVTNATEGADGVYTLTWASQDVSDVLRLRGNKDGFWYEINITIV